MTDSAADHSATKTNWVRVVVNMVVCLVILGVAAYAIYVINTTEPTAQKINSVRKSAALVETIRVLRGDYSPKLVVLGTVEAAQRIQLSPQVGGQITELSDEFIPGGMVRKGDVLLQIDPADFENALLISKSELEQANASMEIEQARQRLAEKELKLLEGAIDESNRGLVLREPQVASIKAQVSAAEASVQRAELNLGRTNIVAPFDAQVLSRSVNVGSQVGPGEELGQLVGVKEYWVNAAVPLRHLRWLQFSDYVSSGDTSKSQNGGTTGPRDTTDEDRSAAIAVDKLDGLGSLVLLRDPDAWGVGVERQARVMRMVGTLDEQTRLARVLISVPDPLGIENGEPPLIIDTLIETEIEGKTIYNVVKLQREYVRDQDTVWLMEKEKLVIKEVEVVFRDAEFAYIGNGIEAGDEIVTTTLATVAEGIGLRKIASSEESGYMKGTDPE